MSKFPPMPKEVAEAMKSRAPYGFSPSGVYDLHHAILTKNHMKGMSDEQKKKIHNVCNILKIPHEHNAGHANVPSTLTAVAILSQREGYNNVKTWFETVEFKSPPFVFPSQEELEELG